MAGMGMFTQNKARKAEKALKEILDKADSNTNGRVELKDFINILEANGVEVKENIYVYPVLYFPFSRWTQQTWRISPPSPMLMER